MSKGRNARTATPETAPETTPETTPAAPTATDRDALRAIFTAIEGWFTALVQGGHDARANTLAKLAWGTPEVRVPVAGMVAAVVRGEWTCEVKTFPILWDVAPSDLVREGCQILGIPEDHILASRDRAKEVSAPELIKALKAAVKAADPLAEITEQMTPSEPKSGLTPTDKRMLRALRSLPPGQDDLYELMVSRLSEAGKQKLRADENGQGDENGQ